MQLASFQNTILKFTKIRVESFNSRVYLLLLLFFVAFYCDLNGVLFFMLTSHYILFRYSLDAADTRASASGSGDCVEEKLSHPALMPCHKLTMSVRETAN